MAVSYSTDSEGHTHESVQHLNAQQAQQLFLENQQRLQSLWAVPWFNPWLVPPTFPSFPPFPFVPFPFLPPLGWPFLPLAANQGKAQAQAQAQAQGKALGPQE